MAEVDCKAAAVAQTVPEKVGVVKAAFLVGEDLGY
jgi:hypothetical protein